MCADVVFIKKRLINIESFDIFLFYYFFFLHTALSVPGKVITHTDINLSLFGGLWMMALAL